MKYVPSLANEIFDGEIYTNFTKAFDKADHGRIIDKLKWQGSIVGPFLLIIFINDLLSSLPVGCGVSFAGDLRVFRSIVN